MYGFLLRPKWLAFHVLIVAAVVVMVSLGFWQLRRLDERRAFNVTVIERVERSPIELTALLDDPGFDPAAAEWLPVTVAGTYLPDQVVVFNRSQAGRAGDNVLTPLALDDGRTVLVNRGFVPLGFDVPPPPATGVEVLGRVRPSQERGRGGLTDAVDGPISEIRRVDIAQLAPQLPGEVVPVYLDLIESEPAVGAGDPAPVPAPQPGEGNHLSYAFQWFIFSACVVVGWVLAIRRSIAARRPDDTAVRPDGRGERTPPDSARSAVDEPTTAPR